MFSTKKKRGNYQGLPDTTFESFFPSDLSHRRWKSPYLLLVFTGAWWDWVHLVGRPLNGLLYQPRDERWWWMWNSRWNENWQGKPKYPEKICRNATFVHYKPHMTWPGIEPGLPRWKAWAVARPQDVPNLTVEWWRSATSLAFSSSRNGMFYHMSLRSSNHRTLYWERYTGEWYTRKWTDFLPVCMKASRGCAQGTGMLTLLQWQTRSWRRLRCLAQSCMFQALPFARTSALPSRNGARTRESWNTSTYNKHYTRLPVICSSCNTATGLRFRQPVFHSHESRPPLGPTQSSSGQNVKLTTHLDLVPSEQMPAFLHKPS
jgi:hypothetical protein